MIGSFSVVANDRAKREVALMIRSVRQFYDIPIYIMCDSEVRAYLREMFSGLNFRVELNEETIASRQRLTKHILRHNTFHDPAIILTKMACMQWAICEANDTLFVDADVRFLKEVHDDIDHQMDIMMSPHYYAEDRVNQCKNYGYFNAGYIWSDNIDMPDEWKELFLTKSLIVKLLKVYFFFEFYFWIPRIMNKI